ncbi:MAG: phage major capsid protein [Candidatus Omnitrophica bacterium]|nr:phage major capsid protein [Candidatus Omnitrophota bacterium]
MPYNSYMDRANDVGALIPDEVEKEIFQAIPESSFVMRLGRRLRDMATHEKDLRVLDGLVTAYFVGATTAASGDKAKIQTSDVSWANKTIRAAKIGVIVPIPVDVLEDQEYDLWGEIKPQLVEAFGAAFDAAVLYGTNAPSDWPTNIVAGATAASNTVSLAASVDLYDAVLSESGLISKVEQSGYMVNGHIAYMGMRSRMRGARDANGNPLFVSDPTSPTRYSFDGEPVYFPRNGVINPSTSLDVCGDWSQLVYSMRKGIQYKMLEEASIHDGSNNLQFNLAQEDMVALRATMRLGWELPTPPNRIDATPYPFAVLTA